ncbi:hypothetical protein K1T73_15090 [Roseovarius sp. SCSIO 43702]|uniref:hypothetical protein n=1 Tax=Roseovarius sp. SCSIO 43702 TaxID=2823043 RepID=UPI001C7325D0|nr:hypothetical protein [Roseovarius sp. SCSIO 43702]QYX56362.1 hypothetical protein K1T73_15090 [Roseovarius sp. SCSIO 43702]
MTALSEYDRLEATGLWRASPEAQRSEVIVSLGDATLVLSDMAERPLAHWSLPAVIRANPGERPAVYHPDGDPGETLELGEDAPEMIAAIEKLRSAIARSRPRPGRLRRAIAIAIVAAIVGMIVFWLPGQLRRHAVAVVPAVKRAEIGDALLAQMQSVTGAPCAEPGGSAALARLAQRLAPPDGSSRLLVMPDGVTDTVALPDETILISRRLVEDHEDPDVLAGHVIAAHMRARGADELSRLLERAGTLATIHLLTTGELPGSALRQYARHLLSTKPAPLSDEVLLDGFRTWSVRSTPYAYERDISGESTLGLIEADPFAGQTLEPVLPDSDWLRLQGICES